MTEVSTPRDEIPPDVLHERLSRESATEAPETLAHDEETERVSTSLAGTMSSDSAVRPAVETPSIGKVSHTESGSSTSELAIDVEDLRLYSRGVKRRDQRGLDLKVPKGIIYGLTGKDPPGLAWLGKYIGGMLQCPDGQVRVLGSVPGTPGSCVPGPGIGYAPRNLMGLEYTVREYLHFSGKIYKMSETSIQHRTRILSELFSLPDDTLLLKDLEEDEIEVVHLAGGLIHSPAILFLVNPFFYSTDPIVRTRVWHQLRRLTREEGLTILLMTVLTEQLESQCDRVGIMCSGRIVAEGPPRLLLDEFKTDTLAEVFLQLTLADEEKPLINESQLNELLGTETRNQDGQNSEMNPTSDVESALSLDSTRAMVHREMSNKLSGRFLELTKMNLFHWTRGKGFFLKQLSTCLLVFYALAGATFVFCHQPIASGKALNVSTDPLEDISNISTASPGDTLGAHRDPSASESMLSGLMFSLIFGMGIATGKIGRKCWGETHRSHAGDGTRPWDIIAASLLAHMCVMLILEAFLLVPVIACFRSFDSIRPESVGLIIVLCYFQGLQGMLLGSEFASDRSVKIPFMFYANTFFSGTAALLNMEYPIPLNILQIMMPQTFPGKALQYVIFRGWGIEHYEVWSGILASIAWSLASALISSAGFSSLFIK